MKLVIDPRQSGLSGDMLISTLTDFFDCQSFTNGLLNSICKIAESLFGIKSSYKVEKVTVNHFAGSKLIFSVEKDFEHSSVETFINNWKTLLKELQVSQKVSDTSFQILHKIIAVEQEVHGQKEKQLSEIHFHELNSIDSIIDITTTVAILDHEQVQEIIGLPTAIGSGTITFSHGTFQQPAPAVAKLLEQTSYPMVSRDLDFELTTPTGLAIITTVADPQKVLFTLPAGRVVKTGIGFGQKQVSKVINFARAWGFEDEQTTSDQESKIYVNNDSMIILETHLDDASGELLGNIIESYSVITGIKDVSIYPLLMKKNRPGHCIRLLIDPHQVDLDDISLKLMKDTGTLGVRHYPVSRHKSAREIVEQKITFENEPYQVRVKISKVGSELIAVKPEYEDIKAISLKTNRSFKEIQDAVLKQINKDF